MWADFVATIKGLVKKVLDLNKDGHVTWDDATYALGAMAEETVTVIKAAAPEFMSLAAGAVMAVATKGSEAKDAALKAVEDAAIALGRQVAADATLHVAGRVAQMFDMPEKMVNTGIEALVMIGAKNRLVPSEGTVAAVESEIAGATKPIGQ